MEKVGENNQILGSEKNISQEEKQSGGVNGERGKVEEKTSQISSELRKE